jgi:hypothetical protein
MNGESIQRGGDAIGVVMEIDVSVSAPFFQSINTSWEIRFMRTQNRWKAATGAGKVLAIAVLAGGVLLLPRAVLASDVPDTFTAQRIAAGYAATPVPVDLKGKNPWQVGIGSYIVNTTGVCNHCHSVNQYYKAGYPQNFAAQKGNPYLLAPPTGPYTGGIVNGKSTFAIDPSTFLAGGQSFGLVLSKNLTPAPNGNVQSPTESTPYYAEGGIDWITYWGVLHNGVDIDSVLTQCNPGSATVPAGCVAAPTNAYLLQVMPWPAIRLLTDSDLNAVWQYLSAIPCNANQSNVNGPSGSNVANTYGHGVLINTCTPAVPGNRYRFYEFEDGKVVPK